MREGACRFGHPPISNAKPQTEDRASRLTVVGILPRLLDGLAFGFSGKGQHDEAQQVNHGDGACGAGERAQA